tara:strand:+ start:83 stop:295 length:213 start_codon:yes stop_codon:yes gene_type:complete
MDNELLSEIRSFLAQTNMGPSYFGKASCGNSELVERLETGRRVWPETADRVRAFMAERMKRAPSNTEAAA